MNQFRSSHLLIALIAVLLVGFYSIDFPSNGASVISPPDFTATTDIDTADNKPISSLNDFNDAIVNIAEQAKSTVVTVRVTKTVKAPPNPFSRFFGQPGDESRQFQREGSGSGVIVSKDGYVLTNNHVVENADEIELTLYNNRKYDAEIIGTDPMTDIAVLKINADNLDVIKLGSSDNLRVGEMVLAIGSPLGPNLAHSVSMGIVSAKGRALGIIEQGGYEDFIQTDAAINPGNSGGALVNMDGELIGINTAIASRSGGNEGIGFSIPIDMAKKIMNSLIEDGKVVRGFLGLSWGGDVDRTMAKALGLDEAQGIIVGSVTEGGPADEAGIQEGDVIKSYNDKPLTNWASFRTEIGTSSPGTEVELGIIRDNEEMEITVTLEEMPEELAMNQTPSSQRDQPMDQQLGFQIRDLTPQIARQLELDPGQEGVVVTQVARGSNAERQGLQKGDVIVEADRKPVEDSSDFKAIISDIVQQDDSVVLLKVIRGGNSQYVAFEL